MYIYPGQTTEIGERSDERQVILRPSRPYYHWRPASNSHEVNLSGDFGGALGDAPGFVDLSNSPPGNTIYSQTNLGIGFAENRGGGSSCVQPITGIFVPKNFKANFFVDLIVYLHGFKDAIPGNNTSIIKYWDGKAFPFFALREGVNASGKNVVLVAPTLGPKSQAGSLVKPNGFDAYLDNVVAALNQHLRLAKKAPGNIVDIRYIILACHSGGGAPMLQIATGNDKQVSKIKQCWGFDSLNSGKTKDGKKLFTQPNAWLKWAPTTSSELFIFFKGSTKAESEFLDDKAKKAKLNNIKVKPSSATDVGKVDAHFWVPITHWKDSIKNATFLSNR